MTEPIIVRRGSLFALVVLLETVAPALVAVGGLWVLSRLYDVEFNDFFVILSVLVALLTLLLPRGSPNTLAQPTGAVPLAVMVIVRWMIIVAVLLAIGYVTRHSEEYARRLVLTWVVITPAVLILVTLVLHEALRRLLFDPALVRRVALVGCNEASLSLARGVSNASAHMGMSIVGFFDDRSPERLGACGSFPLLGTLRDLASYMKLNRVDVIFIALPVRHIRRVMDLLEDLTDTTASIYYLPDLYALDLIQARTGEVLGQPVVAMRETPFYGYRGVVKRVTDLLFSALMLFIAAPLMIAIGIAIRTTSKGPAIFKQRRAGLDGSEIVMYKFRTMTVLEDGNEVVQATRDDVRVTPIGRILRRYSLDELPQLINVLQGRMSLVGPRPHALAHNEQYRKLIRGYMIRHKVPPGITGLAQINGCRGETARVEDMQARVNFDLEYLRRWSPLLDVKILFLTVVHLFHDNKAY
jgi:putative colanic acid biosynthesis UDP-glucose lipid carrier transferase